MDKSKKFAHDAFAQAQRATLEREAEAFKEFKDNRLMETMMSAMVFAGMEPMMRIIDTVQRMGLEDAMHQYEKALMTLAFHEGCVAGRMMEDPK